MLTIPSFISRSCAQYVEAICPRCKRPYFLEEVDDPGVCCYCHRDDVMTAKLGYSWRIILRQQRADAALKGKST